jgi:AraC family transcriptional regulator
VPACAKSRTVSDVERAPLITTLLRGRRISAIDYRCRAARGARPSPESHDAFRIAFVKRGSFGYRTGRHRHELVAGSLLLGRPGREYVCTHEHAQSSDECLAFTFAPDLLDELTGRALSAVWTADMLPPIARLMVMGSLAHVASTGATNVGLEEAAIELAARVIETLDDRESKTRREPTHVDRRRAVRAAELIEVRFADELDLATLAREVGLSPFHFLRLFSRVTGVTPHQYLVRTRLAAAARLLAENDRSITDVAADVGFGDLSSFVRTFGAASGASPRVFRKASRGQRKIFQERISHAS